jgi:GNAT superfamily N-acetyltransferase
MTAELDTCQGTGEGGTVYRTTAARAEDFGQIQSFLKRRPLETAFLIQSVWYALGDPGHPGAVLVCRHGSQIEGVAFSVARSGREGASPRTLDVQMDAASPGAAGALVAALPEGTTLHVQVFAPAVEQFLDSLRGVQRHEDDVYYTVSPDEFRPTTGPDVVELTEADAWLFDGCEQEPNWEYRDEESRLFAVILNGGVAASVASTPITPEGAADPRAVSVGALYTESRYRRRGLAKRLVSHVTELILRDGNVPAYWTGPANLASRRLCEGLGYRHYAQNVNYVWRNALR